MAYLMPNVLDLILYAYTFGCRRPVLSDAGLVVLAATTAAGAFWSMLGGGFSALLWVAFDEPLGLSASYLGWVVSLPLLIVVSLLTDHSPDEDLDMF